MEQLQQATQLCLPGSQNRHHPHCWSLPLRLLRRGRLRVRGLHSRLEVSGRQVEGDGDAATLGVRAAQEEAVADADERRQQLHGESEEATAIVMNYLCN